MQTTDTQPRADGLYRHLGTRGDPSWMRFYPNHRVLSVGSSPALAAQIACWFRDGRTDIVPAGSWRIEGGEILCEMRWEHPHLTSVIHHTRSERCTLSADGLALSTRWSTTSSLPSQGTKHGETDYVFVPVAPRFLDGDGSAKSFRNARSFTALLSDGFDPNLIAAVKKLRGVSLATLNCLEPAELRAAGVDPAFLAMFLPWREGA